jgi:hypothetical protein
MRSIRTMALGLGLLTAVGSAQAGTIFYSNNFENAAPGPEWSTNARYDTATPFTKFMGRYGTTDSVTLMLPPVPADTGNGSGGGGAGAYNLYTVTFDLFAIDKWQGNDPLHGPDLFELKINGTILFLESISNVNTGMQSFRLPDFGPSQVAYGGDKDSIYRNISQDFTVDPAATLIMIKFRSSLQNPMTTESWGIDNVRVSYVTVPAPGSAVLLGLGGLIAGRRRRPR